MPIIPDGFGQLTIGFSGLNAPTGAAVTLGLDVPGGSTPADVLDDIEGLFEGLVESQSVSSLILSSARVKFGPDATGPFVERAYNLPGNQGADAASPNTAILVSKVTAFGGREGRGRLFWPGISDFSLDADGTIGAGSLAQYQTAWDTFFTGLGLANAPAFLLHSDSANTPDAITEFVVQAKVATQRRRLRR